MQRAGWQLRGLGGGPRQWTQAAVPGGGGWQDGEVRLESKSACRGRGGSSGDWAVAPGGGPRLKCQAEEGDRMVKSGWSLRVHAEGGLAAQGTGRWTQAVDPGCSARRRRVTGW